ncbi:hypothetical protein GGI55_001478 [Rhizobium leguminosarum]|uniref:hypothetical protein n=1 Tax=Rhizobium TaxID=379 RepID=UPI001621E930|nr:MULTISPECIES: hypothetical protein [Rhizobium]MBB4296952.1 hypothetical protein [Rhizobium leguminosarum]MBB4415622.1 hypothetical protein [Rhizobium leguminosarum]MBB4431412.1 hypothetical protein [Rhizobium esperanzae]MBB4539974.1 hypothetical protein [Rhizobium leguminosarum]MBB5651633.1 hypothetical protein [Rhizobium leguminosarum]
MATRHSQPWERIGRSWAAAGIIAATGKWWRLQSGVTLAETLRILETDGVLHPV